MNDFTKLYDIFLKHYPPDQIIDFVIHIYKYCDINNAYGDILFESIHDEMDSFCYEHFPDVTQPVVLDDILNKIDDNILSKYEKEQVRLLLV